MKVADLMEHLETGDRTMEHLTNPDPMPTQWNPAAGIASPQQSIANVVNPYLKSLPQMLGNAGIYASSFSPLGGVPWRR